jgi:hypothetical protein
MVSISRSTAFFAAIVMTAFTFGHIGSSSVVPRDWDLTSSLGPQVSASSVDTAALARWSTSVA